MLERIVRLYDKITQVFENRNFRKYADHHLNLFLLKNKKKSKKPAGRPGLFSARPGKARAGLGPRVIGPSRPGPKEPGPARGLFRFFQYFRSWFSSS